MGSIFLDLGGTLVDFKPNFHEPIYFTLVKNGYDVKLKTVYRAVSSYLGRDNLIVKDGNPVIDVEEILKIMGMSVDQATLEELHEIQFASAFYELYHDTIYFLRSLKDRGFKIYIISNASQKINEVVENTGISAFLDGIVASYKLGKIKPNPDIFKEGIRLAGETGPYVGDLYEVDYIGAERAGLEPVLLDRNGFYDDLKVRKAENLIKVLSYL